MALKVGSARIDENGRVFGGRAGDQTGFEVAIEKFYIHSLGWVRLRPKDANVAEKIAERMRAACANNNIGYNQNDRLGVVLHGIDTKIPCGSDCSSLVRKCVQEATGVDAGNFTTGNEVQCLLKTGLFEGAVNISSEAECANGDVLVTRSKGHTVIVVSGRSRVSAPTANSATGTKSVDTVAREVLAGQWGNGDDRRNRLAAAGYDYNQVQALVNKLVNSSAPAPSVSYYTRYTGGSGSIVDALRAIGEDASYGHRAQIAAKNGIGGYQGTAEQNIAMLNKLKAGTLIK